jgi:hypothetical protein
MTGRSVRPWAPPTEAEWELLPLCKKGLSVVTSPPKWPARAHVKLSFHTYTSIYINVLLAWGLSFSLRNFRVTVATNCRALSCCMNGSYVACHVLASSLFLFKYMVSIMRVLVYLGWVSVAFWSINCTNESFLWKLLKCFRNIILSQGLELKMTCFPFKFGRYFDKSVCLLN